MKKLKPESIESMSKSVTSTQKLVQQQVKTAQKQVNAAQSLVEKQVNLIEEKVASAQSQIEEKVASAQSQIEEQVASAQSQIEEQVASAQSQVEEQVNLIEEQVASAQSQVEEQVASVQSQVEEQVASVQSQVEEQVASVQSQVEEQVASLQSQVEEQVASVQSQVEEQINLIEEQVASAQSLVEEQVASTQSLIEEQVNLIEDQTEEVQSLVNEHVSSQQTIEVNCPSIHCLVDIEPVTEQSVHESLDIHERHVYTLEIEQENHILSKKEVDNNQDYKQKFSVLSTLSLELYRMLTSSLLILFVPQNCGGELCTITENLVWDPDQHLYNTGIFFNFLTLFTFTTLYYIEVKRENRLIKYLDVNPNLPMSNEAVKTTLENISVDKKNKILSADKQYQIISYISICIFALNSLISGIVVFNFYLGSQTTTTLITSLLFMISKLFNIYSISNTEQNIFYSAYMSTRIQFNDLDETHKIIV